MTSSDARSAARSQPTRRIALVSCGKQKVNVPKPAQELYTSNLFKLSRRYAERFDAWYILSAFHELVLPETELIPYDRSLKDKSVREREAWARCVQGKLLFFEPGIYAGDGDKPGSAGASTTITLLAGGLYVSVLRDYLDFDTPLAGKGTGDRQHWLKEQLTTNG